MHILKTEEALLKTQLQPLLFGTLKHKTHVLEVLLHGATVDIDIVEINRHELV
jgi:hypothetical protein